MVVIAPWPLARVTVIPRVSPQPCHDSNEVPLQRMMGVGPRGMSFDGETSLVDGVGLSSFQVDGIQG